MKCIFEKITNGKIVEWKTIENDANAIQKTRKELKKKIINQCLEGNKLLIRKIYFAQKVIEERQAFGVYASSYCIDKKYENLLQKCKSSIHKGIYEIDI